MSNFKVLLLGLILATGSLQAQDSLQVAEPEPEKVVSAESYVPLLSAVGLIVDYGKLAGLFLKSESKYEVGTQLEFKNKMILIGEYGLATLHPKEAYLNAGYEVHGQYFRVGLGYKIDMNDKNNLYLSARYARASFSDQGVIDISSSSGIYDDLKAPFERNGLAASWYEVALSSEARLWKGLYAGFHLRLRIMGKYDKQEPLDVYAIPGYGRSFDKSIPALNLYLKYALERF